MTAFLNYEADTEPAHVSPRHGRTVALADSTLALSMVTEFLIAARYSTTAYRKRMYDEHMRHEARMRRLLPLIRDIAERIYPSVVPDLIEPDQVFYDESGDPAWHWGPAERATETLAGVLEHQDVHEQIFGESGPSLAASGLHKWVWEAAKGRWDAGYYGDAVHAAAEVISQKTKVKLGRRDITGTSLYSSAFSLDPPKPGEPRLRFPSVDEQDKDTWRSAHQGAMHLGMACSLGIRNRQAHKTADRLTEQEALEQLGALSILARWVENAVLESP